MAQVPEPVANSSSSSAVSFVTVLSQFLRWLFPVNENYAVFDNYRPCVTCPNANADQSLKAVACRAIIGSNNSFCYYIPFFVFYHFADLPVALRIALIAIGFGLCYGIYLVARHLIRKRRRRKAGLLTNSTMRVDHRMGSKTRLRLPRACQCASCGSKIDIREVIAACFELDTKNPGVSPRTSAEPPLGNPQQRRLNSSITSQERLTGVGARHTEDAGRQLSRRLPSVNDNAADDAAVRSTSKDDRISSRSSARQHASAEDQPQRVSAGVPGPTATEKDALGVVDPTRGSDRLSSTFITNLLSAHGISAARGSSGGPLAAASSSQVPQQKPSAQTAEQPAVKQEPSPQKLDAKNDDGQQLQDSSIPSTTSLIRDVRELRKRNDPPEVQYVMSKKLLLSAANSKATLHNSNNHDTAAHFLTTTTTTVPSAKLYAEAAKQKFVLLPAQYSPGNYCMTSTSGFALTNSSSGGDVFANDNRNIQITTARRTSCSQTDTTALSFFNNSYSKVELRGEATLSHPLAPDIPDTLRRRI